MRYLICVLLLCGCGGKIEVGTKPAEFTVTVQEQILTKQDESIVILRENTTALAAIKSQVESLSGNLLETRRAVGTMEASLSSADLNRKDGDPAATEPQEATRPNPSQPLKPVGSPPAVRLSSTGVKMKWNVEGNWNPSILETAKHLREDHGIIADGMTPQQMHDAHAAAHEGRPVAMRQQPVQMLNRGTSCPGGVCPTPRNMRVRWRR